MRRRGKRTEEERKRPVESLSSTHQRRYQSLLPAWRTLSFAILILSKSCQSKVCIFEAYYMLYFIPVFFLVKNVERVDMAVENIIIKGTEGTGDATKFECISEFASDHSGLSICCLICKI